MSQESPPALTREQVREVDRIAIEQLGLPGIALMENAGRNAAHLLLKQNPEGEVLILAGGGNNGGDGFVIARHLHLAGGPVNVLLAKDPAELTGDAAVNFHVMDKLGIPHRTLDLPDDFPTVEQAIAHSEWIVDALFGTGLSSTVRASYDRLIETVNRAGKNVLAVDLPSGLDCDTGKPLGCAIKSTRTVTFVAMKRGFLEEDAMEWTGVIDVADIGVPARILQQFGSSKRT